VGLRGTELQDNGPQIATSAEAVFRLVEKVTGAGQSAVETGQLKLTVT
jgi:hypothetical protein